VFMSVLIVLLLVAVHHSAAQIKGQMTTADILATLKPGQWAQLEGTIRPDMSIICTEVKLLTGDLLDDDWEITGAIRKVNQEKKEVEILRVPIKVQSDTEFKDKAGTLKSFADVKTRLFVRAEGTYLKDGTFLAKQIRNRSPEPGEKADPDLQTEIEVVGRVEKIDPTNRTITLMGMSFQLNDRTKGKSAIK
jgi:predicted RNA-binding protein